MNDQALMKQERPAPTFRMGSFGVLPATLAVFTLLLMLAGCSPAVVTDGPRLSFQERSHDFGQVSASQKTEYRFAFINAGNRPLEIIDSRPEPARPGT